MKFFLIYFLSLSFFVKAQTTQTVNIELESVTNDTIRPNKEYKIKPIKGYTKLSYACSGNGVRIYRVKNAYFISCTGGDKIVITAIHKRKALLPNKIFYVKD